MAYKLGIMVRNHAFGHAKDMDNIVQEQISHLKGCDTIMDRGEYHTFGGTINNSHDTSEHCSGW